MKVYTRTGDAGETSLVGARVKKEDVLIEAMGQLDELNSHIGLAIAHQTEPVLIEQLTTIQHLLFDLGSEHMYAKEPKRRVDLAVVSELEGWIDELERSCPVLERFILPGGTIAAAQLHVCRTVCRRVERFLSTFERGRQQLPFFNRLSDYLFTAARYANAKASRSDVEYARGAVVFRQPEKGEEAP